ncbi:hypothetical protein [Micrococcus luteus]|nr:hypothetical protein [Micrococcus luteus]
MNQRSRTLPQLFQPIARAAFWTATTAVGFFMLAAPSLITGPC